MSKLESIFGETATRQIVNVNKRTGEKRIFFDLDLCKLHGIDIVGIINDYAENHKWCVIFESQWSKLQWGRSMESKKDIIQKNFHIQVAPRCKNQFENKQAKICDVL